MNNPIAIRISEDLLAKINEEAKKNERSGSAQIRHIIKNHYEKNGNTK